MKSVEMIRWVRPMFLGEEKVALLLVNEEGKDVVWRCGEVRNNHRGSCSVVSVKQGPKKP